MKQSQEKSHIAARNVKPIEVALDQVLATYQDLGKLGIGITERTLNQMMSGMDTIEPTVSTASIGTPIQFLQSWLPGFVRVITAARKIDEFTGITTAGTWEDEEIVQGVLEMTGTSVPYGDFNNVPMSSWNAQFERRTIVRFEEGMQVGRLEEARAAKIRVNSASEKREGAALALEIQRNRIGFYGFNSGNGRTYGFLNDPALPAYVSVALNGGATSRLWARKTFLEITADIRAALVALRAQSLDQIDPETSPITLGLATSVVDYLSVTSDFGISVRDWLTKAYPKVRIVSAPELTAANGGDNAMYVYADQVSNLSSDDGRTFIQVVPAKFQVLGVQQLAKGYLEDYTNATAGVMCKRPYAVVRRSGI